MDEHYYLYALIERAPLSLRERVGVRVRCSKPSFRVPFSILASPHPGPLPEGEGDLEPASCNNPAPTLGPGVDPRFEVEVLPCGRIAGVTSRVGLDQFHPEKLQAATPDVVWLSEIALRHNAIVDAAAARTAVLPLRLGAVFHSRRSLLEKLEQYEAPAADFLHRLGDRQEWAVKVYLDQQPAAESPLPEQPATTGTQYLATRRLETQQQHQLQAARQQELQSLEQRFQRYADGWTRLRPLSPELTGREEKMLLNAALLVSRAGLPAFQAVSNSLTRDYRRRGLMVEVSGPWPPYHFCPSFKVPSPSGRGLG